MVGKNLQSSCETQDIIPQELLSFYSVPRHCAPLRRMLKFNPVGVKFVGDDSAYRMALPITTSLPFDALAVEASGDC